MPQVKDVKSMLAGLRAALLVIVLLTTACLARAAAGPRAASPGAPPLPDTVLAEIGGGETTQPARQVGRSRFVRGWSQVSPPARSDSLTPEGARRFLELLVDKEALGLLAARERWTWTSRESAAFEVLRDRLVVEAMLDSMLAEVRRSQGPAGDSLDREALGLVARDRAMERLEPAFDDSLIARLARAFAALERPSADSSVFAQLRVLGASPEVSPPDTGRVVARSAAGDYRVRELLASWARLNPLARPRVETPEQVRDLVRNGLFERELRRAGAAAGLERRPDVAQRLASQREFNDVSHLVAREVYQRIATDSLTLLHFYRETEGDWALPTRVRLLRLVLPERSEADAMALRLRRVGEAESLAAGARRAGTEWTLDVSAERDSVLFARALTAGTGTVLGPDRVPEGWAVARVMAVLPGHGRPFSRVRELVLHRWYGEEGERLMRALLSRARAGLRIRVNEEALEALVRDPPPGLHGTRP
jgi:hypothetical protein